MKFAPRKGRRDLDDVGPATDVVAASTPALTDKSASAFGHRREIPMAT